MGRRTESGSGGGFLGLEVGVERLCDDADGHGILDLCTHPRRGADCFGRVDVVETLIVAGTQAASVARSKWGTVHR